MAKNYKLLYYGLGSDAIESIRKLKSVDLAIARGSTAMNILKMEHISNAQLFSRKPDHTLEQWKQELFSGLKDDATILYLSPIVPMISDQVGWCLCKDILPENIEINRGEDMSFGLTSLFSHHQLSPLVTVDSLVLENKHHPPFSPDNSVLIYTIDTNDQIHEIQKLLSGIFPQDHLILPLIQKPNGEIGWGEVSLSKLGEIVDPVTILFVPPATHDSSLESFQEIIAHLRA
ncbi:MAG: hypothetical protein Q8R09_02035, partial [Anaerolineaceae bacterium]|nr:hypothetical protein [Anaerolineaceae bacterium]